MWKDLEFDHEPNAGDIPAYCVKIKVKKRKLYEANVPNNVNAGHGRFKYVWRVKCKIGKEV